MPRLLLVHQPVDGGVARHVVDTFGGLQGQGWEVWLCGPAPPSPSALETSPSVLAAHVPLAMSRAISPGNDLRARRELLAIVQRLQPDLIHAHSSKAGALARMLHPLRRTLPVIYTPHGFAFAGHFQRPAERFVYRAAERVLMPVTDRVLAVCEAEARLARTIGGGDRVRVVHNGVDIPLEGPRDPRVRELRRRGPVICAATQLRPGKGVETLLDALPAVRRGTPNVQLALVGDGPLAPALRERAAGLGLEGAVHFLGEHRDPISALRAADVFVLASWAESFPYVVLEAMAAGLPIVATDVGGVREAIEHESSGLLVPAGDARRLGEALSRVCDDEGLARALAGTARARVEVRFTVAGMVAGVAAVYEEVLDR